MAPSDVAFRDASETCPSPIVAMFAGFANMYCVGSFYALSIISDAINYQMKPDFATRSWFTAPFASVCTGLAIGLAMASALISLNGPYFTAGLGTFLWGTAAFSASYYLDHASLFGLVCNMAVGGVGIGWTYLAAVVLASQGLPGHPLAGSAIGPLGFSSGAATVLAIRGAQPWRGTSAGPVLVVGGLVSVVVGMATILGGPKHTPVVKADISVDSSSRLFLAVLLFFNAFPGMVVFTALMPMVFQFKTRPVLLPCCLLALSAGGILAPSLRDAFGGPRPVFVALFCLRGVVLLVQSFSPYPQESPLLAGLLLVLFSHGCGFSLLPAVIKAQQPGFAAFYTAYGQILPVWGAAGVAAALFLHLVGPNDLQAVTFCVGCVTSVFGGVLCSYSRLGAAALGGT